MADWDETIEGGMIESPEQRTEEINRKVTPVFFLIDVSGSMSGKKIDIVNNSMEAIMRDLSDMDSADFDLRFAVLSFETNCVWVTGDKLQPCDGEWDALETGSLTYFNTACRELKEKLSGRHGFFNFATGKTITPPVIILLTDGYANDGDADGKDGIELHHLTSEERNRSSLFFNGEDKEGALVEIQSSKHSKYKKQLHAINEPNNSFRKRTDTIVSEDGTISRQRVKTADAEQYERFRPQYWKDRAAEIEQQRTNTGGETMDRWVDKSPEERQKILQSQKDAADKWNANHSGKKSSSEDEGKGQRERTPDHSNDKGQSR